MVKKRKGRKSTVRLGKRTRTLAKNTAPDFNTRGARRMVKLAVTMAAAIMSAHRAGFSLQLVGPHGRWYSYDPETPKIAYVLDSCGMRTGEIVDLIDGIPKPAVWRNGLVLVSG